MKRKGGKVKEISGDMFSPVYVKFADAVCVTTNGVVKKMGRQLWALEMHCKQGKYLKV